MNNFNKINPFEFYCQKVIPLIYDDSLSYYEVLCKIRTILNEVIKSQNELGQAFSNLLVWIEKELKQFTTEQLNEWLEDGTLENLINLEKLNAMKKELIELIQQIAIPVNSMSGTDTEKINSAINYANIIGSKTIILAGEYTTMSPINVPDNFTLISQNASIIQGANFDGILLMGNNTTIKGALSLSIEQSLGSGKKCAVAIGEYLSGIGVSSVYIEHIKLYGGFPNCNGVFITGDSNNIHLGTVEVPNDNTLIGRPVLCHWGNANDHYPIEGIYYHVPNYKPTTHPHDIRIDHIKFKKLSQINPMNGAILCSASYNISVGRVNGEQVDNAVNIISGDLGFGYADDEVKKALKTFNIEEINVNTITSRCALNIVGTSLYENFIVNYDVKVNSVNIKEQNGSVAPCIGSSYTKSLTIDKCYIGKSFIGISIGDNCENILINNAIIENTSKNGIILGAKISSPVKNVNLINPRCINCGSGGTTDAEKSSIQIYSAINANINNPYIDNSKYGIYITDNNKSTVINNGYCTNILSGFAIYGATSNYDELSVYGMTTSENIRILTNAKSSLNISRNKIAYEFALPTTGAWNKTDIIFNLNATNDGENLGWVCVESGNFENTAPRFKPFGVLNHVVYRNGVSSPIDNITPNYLGEMYFQSGTTKKFFIAVGLTNADWKSFTE